VKYVSSGGTAFVCNGLTGANGANGAGLPVCPAPDEAVLYHGAFACKSTLPHFLDNGDGTVTDNQTGLMWEKKTSTCGGEVTCINNSYSWSSTGTLADGTLFTSFIAGLNGGDYYSPSAGQVVSEQPGPCLANHCDWRIPTVVELNSIIESGTGCAGGLPCIDPAFGPTQASGYWSSSSGASNVNLAWGVTFYYGGAAAGFKTAGGVYARAVRSSR
jgi:hypothetical protein